MNMPYNILESNMGRAATVLISSCSSMLIPIRALALIVLAFIIVDFVLGLVVSIRIKKQGFVSHKAYRTIWKLIGAELCILMAYLLDVHVLDFLPDLFLANIFTGIICGVDLWSILTNFAILSDHPAFKLIKKWGKSEIENKLGLKLEQEQPTKTDEKNEQ